MVMEEDFNISQLKVILDTDILYNCYALDIDGLVLKSLIGKLYSLFRGGYPQCLPKAFIKGPLINGCGGFEQHFHYLGASL